MTGTVFVIQQPRPNNSGWLPDLSSASSYGKIEYIFDSHEKVFALPGPSLFKARKALKDFDCEKDYLLWPGVGDPAAMTVTLLALAEKDMPFLKQLYWDRKRNDDGARHPTSGFYVPLTFNIKEKRDGSNS